MGDYYETSYVKSGRMGRKPRLCVTYRDADGRRCERTRAAEPKRASALRREAEEWRAELNREHEEEMARRAAEEERRKCPTLGECMADWLAERSLDVGLVGVPGGIEASTYRSYRNISRYILEPDLGIAGLPANELDARAIGEWERRLTTIRGLGPSSVASARRLLVQLVRWLLDREVIERDPFLKVRRRRHERRENNALDRVSVAKLRKWIRETGPTGFRTAVALALYAGMRRGECCALRWRDVDLREGYLRVEHAIGHGEDGQYLKCPKNGSTRAVPISDDLAEALAERRDAAFAEALRTYEPDEAALRFPDLYVCGYVNGTWLSIHTVDTYWTRLRKKLGIRGMKRDRCPFHDLRHTFITYQLYAGVPALDLMPIVGHSNVSMTLDGYAASDPTRVAGMGPRLDSAFPDLSRDDDAPGYELPDAG